MSRAPVREGPMRLRQLQQELQRDLLGNESAITEAIVDAPPLPAQARLDIYRNAYRARLSEALDDVYTVLHKLLGDETFASMAELFIEANPSVHRSIRWYGRELGDFLAEQAPFCEQPILAEVARFEWALSEAFDAPDVRALDRSALHSVDPAGWADLTLRFHPSIRRLAFEWNTVAAWRGATDDEQPPSPTLADEPVPWLIWRRDFENFFRSLDAAESTALDAALEGRSFADICEALTSFLDEDEVPMRAATLVATWLDSGIIVGIETEGSR